MMQLKKYYLAIVCSSSAEGDYFMGAPGSTLFIDSFTVTPQ
ncbi:PCMD domain-containing protein [Bacteroides thetaiotaomicron]